MWKAQIKISQKDINIGGKVKVKKRNPHSEKKKNKQKTKCKIAREEKRVQVTRITKGKKKLSKLLFNQ